MTSGLTKHLSPSNILVGDIGGTNTRLLFINANGEKQQQSYLSQQYDNLLPIIILFCDEHEIDPLSISSACFAIAGPIKSFEQFQTAKVTNLPWEINARQISEHLTIPHIKLINDFSAIGHGIESLETTDYIEIQEGSYNNSYPTSAILGAGTGLGVALRVSIDNKYHIIPSEAGHINFAPENELQTQLLSWMMTKHKHTSLEKLLSGRGFEEIYNFLHQIKNFPTSNDIEQAIQLRQSKPSTNIDIAQQITENALADKDEICIKTLECFIDIYASSAGNIALQYYPIDEVYIAGGIAEKIKDKLIGERFLQLFSSKGLMSNNLKKVSIKLITQGDIGLIGAQNYINR